MISNKVVHESVPSYDDGWWSSVLADEERFVANPQRPRPAPAAAQRPAPVEKPVAAPAEPEQAPAEPVSTADWEQARTVYQQDQIVCLSVTGYNRGGLLVEGIGLQGFVPFSHLVEMVSHPEGDGRDQFLASFVGKEMKLKIIECVPEEGRVVFSERAARSEVGCRARLFTSLSTGMHVTGEVTNITDFGVFIDLGGVEGLIHISELSWGRVVHPSDFVSLGQKLEVQVLDVSPERCRVALSLKRLQANPWENVRTRYTPNIIVPAEITTVVSYGAFARLEEGLEGLIHISEIPMHPGTLVKDYLAPGQKLDVRILQVDSNHQRLGLSLKLDAM